MPDTYVAPYTSQCRRCLRFQYGLTNRLCATCVRVDAKRQVSRQQHRENIFEQQKSKNNIDRVRIGVAATTQGVGIGVGVAEVKKDLAALYSMELSTSGGHTHSEPIVVPQISEKPIFETAKEALKAATQKEYHLAAKAVAPKKAKAEINAAALAPGIIVHHAFTHKRCLLLEKTKDGWEIELENGNREHSVPSALLNVLESTKWTGFWSVDEKTKNYNYLLCFLLIFLLFVCGPLPMILELLK